MKSKGGANRDAHARAIAYDVTVVNHEMRQKACPITSSGR